MSKEKKEKSAIYNIVAFNFAGKDTAKETVKEIKKSGASSPVTFTKYEVEDYTDNDFLRFPCPG